MMDLQELPLLVRRLQASGVTLFECQSAGGLLRLRLNTNSDLAPSLGPTGTQAQPGGGQSVAAAPGLVRSPGMGRVRLRHPLGAEPIAAAGSAVTADQVLALLEVDDILAPLESDRAGTIAEWLVQDGDLVGYGTPLAIWR